MGLRKASAVLAVLISEDCISSTRRMALTPLSHFGNCAGNERNGPGIFEKHCAAQSVKFVNEPTKTLQEGMSWMAVTSRMAVTSLTVATSVTMGVGTATVCTMTVGAGCWRTTTGSGLVKQHQQQRRR